MAVSNQVSNPLDQENNDQVNNMAENISGRQSLAGGKTKSKNTQHMGKTHGLAIELRDKQE